MPPTQRPSEPGQEIEALTLVAFGDPDLRTVYLGSQANNRVASFRLRRAALLHLKCRERP